MDADAVDCSGALEMRHLTHFVQAQKIFQHDSVIALRDQDSVQVLLFYRMVLVPANPCFQSKECADIIQSRLMNLLLSCVQDMRKRLEAARRVMIVGNGGIALELVCVHPFAQCLGRLWRTCTISTSNVQPLLALLPVPCGFSTPPQHDSLLVNLSAHLSHALRTVERVWTVRNNHIGDAFFDLDAAAFLFSEINNDARAASHPSCGSLDSSQVCCFDSPNAGTKEHQEAPDLMRQSNLSLWLSLGWQSG